MKFWIILLTLSFLIFVPLQFVDYYNGGDFKVGLPLSWETDSMGSDPGGGDTWFTSRDYWAFPFNYLAVLVALLFLWGLCHGMVYAVIGLIKDTRRQIREEKQIRSKRRGR